MNHTQSRLLLLFVSILLTGAPALAQSEQEQREQQRQEESQDYFQKWLEEDAAYIITDEEKAIFTQLATPEEKEQFIEQFWFRRDPDLSTATNEFKEEHYRRISFANDRYTSAIPGWKTDRGRVYIIHGPPQELESHPTGGAYTRPLHEGGGTTGTYPFEIWRYRHLEGVGFDIELLFVDPTFTEEFRLAMRPEEKDAFLNVGGGWTMLEEMGLANKSDRPYFRPANTSLLRGSMMFTRAQDMPFQRYERYTFVNKAPEIKYKDLKELVNVNISYRELPLRVRKDYFRLNDLQVLVPITIEVPNQELSFTEENGSQVGKIAIYGVITSLNNRVVAEFDDDMKVSFPSSELSRGLQRRTMYQKVMPLDSNTRYKLDLVVKDLGSGKMGVTREAIIPQVPKEGELGASSVILTPAIRPLEEIPDEEEMFVIGDVWVLPILNKTFYRNEPLGIYLQVYNLGMDQTTYSPSVVIKYQVLKEGEVVSEFVDKEGVTIQYHSPRRAVLIGGVPVEDLEPGRYELQVEVTDLISEQVVNVTENFELADSYQLAENRK